MKIRILQLLPCLLLLFSNLPAQLAGWSHKAVVDAVETAGVSHTNYQIRYTFDSQALINAGKLQANGGDLRFGDICGTTLYPYWIESGLNTSNTVVWILVPAVAANDTTSMYMHYGNLAAPDGNDFPGTFPNAIRTNGGNLTLTGSLTPDFVWIEANDTLFLTAGAVLTLSNVRKLRIDATGQLNGVGRGFQGPAINTIGTGPGGGGTSTNSGCGGGSYGGVGGTGGMDTGDTPGTGGPAYGTASGTDCQMGSSGGSGTGVSTGGHGGGAVEITAEWVEINGSVNMGGRAPASDGTGRGGGGGAGGCIKITCATADGSGGLTASGGNGATGTSTANDSGGGGGGGRIKSFSQAAWPGTITQAVTGGVGGPYGNAAPGQPGAVGSTNNAVQAFTEANPTMLTGVEMSLPEITDTNTYVCSGNLLQLDATPGMSAYAWSTGDTTAFTDVSASGTYSVTITDLNGCTSTDSIVLGNVTPLQVVITGAGTVCANACDTLVASNGFVGYQWNTAANTQSIVECVSGMFSVEGIDSNGCSSMDTFIVNVMPPVIVNIPPPATVCDGDTTLLDASGAYLTWTWSTGATTPTIQVSATGNYTVSVTDSLGCTGSGTFSVTYVPLPNPVIAQSGNNLSVTPSFPTYQWFLNGSQIPGATAQTYTATTTGIYSVQVVDANGCMNMSDTTSVVVGLQEQMQLGAMLFPNPTTKATTLQFALDENASVEVRVVDALGKTVLKRQQQSGAGTVRIDLPLEAIAAGIYQVQVAAGTRHQTLRLVKQ